MTLTLTFLLLAKSIVTSRLLQSADVDLMSFPVWGKREPCNHKDFAYLVPSWAVSTSLGGLFSLH